MKDIWREVLEAAQQGQAPVLKLSPTARVQPHKRQPGRPRVRGATMFGHYAGYQPKRIRPRCMMRGCTKRLKRDQKAFCSEKCTQQAIDEARALLALAGVTS